MPEDVKLVKMVEKTDNISSLRPFHKRKQLERDVEHITAEMYKRNRELAETNKTLSLLRTIDTLALESHTTLKLVCEHITEAITQVTDYPFVGLLTRTSSSKEQLSLYGSSLGTWFEHAQNGMVFSKPVHIKLVNPWFTEINSSKLISLEDLSDETLAEFLDLPQRDIQTARKQLPLKSLYVVKLQARRQIVGLLFVGFMNSAVQLSQTDTVLLDRLSETIGVALDNKLLFEENQRVLKQLQDSNSKLRALDEAKDDFISMASHQLRTPLTSIKGYTSMVLEGDSGKITPMQKKLLSQSFTSAQRMVYLIADLLNVSRLRTGKFVIDVSRVNLANVVKEEVEQLMETAASRSLKLTYTKPKNFPELMLDETKTRQVIMNFADNAIYYTPAGGHIKVELVENPKTIELKVIDNGMGVPKHEKPRLFTKFYRAENARKARPDGTGLGLFMAKKVITAQGGAIIFDSHEGKGSTFGFMFDKKKLAPTDKPATSPEKQIASPAKQ
jgi:signal transduction histidine kinase